MRSDKRVDSGAQPLTNADDSIILAVNGEIYNHRLIRKTLETPYHFKTHSDCEVVIPLVGLQLQDNKKKKAADQILSTFNMASMRPSTSMECSPLCCTIRRRTAQ